MKNSVCMLAAGVLLLTMAHAPARAQETQKEGSPSAGEEASQMAEAYPVLAAKENQKASYGYTHADRQGYNGWYYRAGTDDLIWSARDARWGTEELYIQGEKQHAAPEGKPAAKVFRVPENGDGTVVIAGCVRNGSDTEEASFSIERNGERIYPAEGLLRLMPGDQTGVWFELPVTLCAGDEISFLCHAGTLLTNPTIAYDYREQKIHFDFSGQYENGLAIHVGDVHPFWHDGVLYMYYLRTDGTYGAELMTSEDFINFTPQALRRISPEPTIDSYYVLGVVPYGDLFVSYFGASASVINGSVSRDLTHWARIDANAAGRALPNIHYPAGGRDPYVFFDPDAGRYRVIYNAAYAKRENKDFDVALSLQTSVSADLEDGWEEEEKELLRFDNFGSSKREDPECPQMMKIGDRWYIFASLYSRSVHGVGRLSYWQGEAGKTIEETNWADAYEQFLDGEDICAAQLVEADGRYYMFGWVPQTAEGGAWGGALSLAREVYALPNGDLATRLDPALARRLNQGLIYSCPEEISLTGGENRYQFKAYTDTALEGVYGRVIVDAVLDVARSSRAGFVLTDPNTVNRHFIYVDRSMSMLYVMVKAGGSYSVRAKTSLQVSDWSHVCLKVLIDGDIVDVFVNDQASLAAKLSSVYDLEEITIHPFADGSAVFRDLTVSKLAPAQMLND